MSTEPKPAEDADALKAPMVTDEPALVKKISESKVSTKLLMPSLTGVSDRRLLSPPLLQPLPCCLCSAFWSVYSLPCSLMLCLKGSVICSVTCCPPFRFASPLPATLLSPLPSSPSPSLLPPLLFLMTSPLSSHPLYSLVDDVGVLIRRWRPPCPSMVRMWTRSKRRPSWTRRRRPRRFRSRRSVLRLILTPSLSVAES